MEPLLWHEPAKYRRAKFRQREKYNPMESVRFAAFAFVVILALRGLAGMRPAPDAHPPGWLPTVGVALGVAVFVAYILPRLESLLANSIVILSEKGVNNNSVWGGATIRFWPWEKVDYCYVWTEQLYDRSYPVLSFCDSENIVLATVCRSDKVPLSEVEKILEAYQIPVEYEK